MPILVDDVHVMSLDGMDRTGNLNKPIPEKDAFEPGTFAWIRHFCDTGLFLGEDGRESFQVPRAWMAISGCHNPLLNGPWRMSNRLTRHLWIACMGEWINHQSPASLFMYQISSPILRSSIEYELKNMFASIKREALPSAYGEEEMELTKALKEEQSWLQMCTDSLNTAMMDLGSRIGSILTMDNLEVPRALFPNLRSLMYMLSDMKELLRAQTVARRKLLPNSVPRVASTFVYCASSSFGDRIGDPQKLDNMLEAIVSVAMKTLVPLDRSLLGTIALDSESLTTEYLEAVAHRGFASREVKVVAEDPRIQFESLHAELLNRRNHPAFDVCISQEGEPEIVENCFKRVISRMLLPDMPSRVHRLAFALERPTVTDYLCLAGAPGSGRRSALRMACALVDARYIEVSRAFDVDWIVAKIGDAASAAFGEERKVVVSIRCDVDHLASLMPVVQLVNQGVFPLSMQSVVEPDLLRESERGGVATFGYVCICLSSSLLTLKSRSVF